MANVLHHHDRPDDGAAPLFAQRPIPEVEP
jgi:hypothetical protein